MTDEELKLRQQFTQAGRSLFERGYATGAAGNMSLILPDGTVICTPTGSSLGALSPEGLSQVDMDGKQVAGPKATKEVKLHLAVYRHNPGFKAIVHLHSTYATAYASLEGLDPTDCLRAITPYVVMRMGRVALVPYFKPGSDALVAALDKVAAGRKAFLLANHGPVTAGASLTEALNNAEELEASCENYFVLNGPQAGRIRYLTDAEIKELL